MNFSRLFELLQSPRYLARRVAYKGYELLHQDEPWIAQGAVEYCDQRLTRTMRGLEWGSGRSTLWFAKRLLKLTSVEHSANWHARVKQRLSTVHNVDYRHVPLDHDEAAPTAPIYDPIPRYVAIADEFPDQSLDFVVVDGHYRQACVLAAIPKLRPGGLLLVDNSNWLPLESWGLPADFRLVHQSENVMSQTTIWEK